MNWTNLPVHLVSGTVGNVGASGIVGLALPLIVGLFTKQKA